jgi:hypothetical protein
MTIQLDKAALEAAHEKCKCDAYPIAFHPATKIMLETAITAYLEAAKPTDADVERVADAIDYASQFSVRRNKENEPDSQYEVFNIDTLEVVAAFALRVDANIEAALQCRLSAAKAAIAAMNQKESNN